MKIQDKKRDNDSSSTATILLFEIQDIKVMFSVLLFFNLYKGIFL